MKEKVKKAIKSGVILYNGTTVTFPDGHQIGGIMAKSQEQLAEIICACLQREDFSAAF